jgi:hypothetical protein
LFHEILLFQDLIRQLGSTYGNGQLELLDWFPLFAVILAAALVFNSLIPATVIGRNIARKDEDMLGSSSLYYSYCIFLYLSPIHRAVFSPLPVSLDNPFNFHHSVYRFRHKPA